MIDLRSDTVTRPTAGMRRAMAEAEVGDDVYGEDPTVLALQERVAAMLGHEAALFTPTGSMANQLGLRLLARPGEEVLCDSQAHVVRAELGAHAAFGSVTTRTWNAPDGAFAAADVIGMAVPESSTHLVRTGVVAVENTHNFGGGTVQPLDELEKLAAWARESSVRLHLDGARLWNAAVATGTSLEAYGRLFDAVSVCLSKGLGAPVGSLVAGSSDLVTGARWWRKRLGGGMRQVGVLAAAGLYALDHHIDRLAEDHARAAELARRLAEVTPGVSMPQTNIIVLDLPDGGPVAADLVTAAHDRGVLVSLIGPRTIRLVTHLDVDDAACARAADVLCRLF
ncbi:GntG family PLP-dependent aldolase [Sporichthya brevicatena]|uniref:GntG family PLP-dependent aldolase n=1 Tax=Sporichthya brevicatena TaxID=171442 RepID=A0ABN1GZQ3_9ACTN